MPRLIAKVLVVALVGGVRQEFPPGSELPELSPHDVAELKRVGAIEDLDETAAAEKTDRSAARRATLEFEQARKDVAAQLESIAPPAVPVAQPKKPAGAK